MPYGVDSPIFPIFFDIRRHNGPFHAYTFAMTNNINEDIVAVPVNQGVLDSVSNAEFYNPHEVLGGHLGIGEHEDCVTVRVLRPPKPSPSSPKTANTRHPTNTTACSWPSSRP